MVAFVVAFGAMLAMTSVAEAGRKRLVVLDFEGPKASQFQADLVALLKKSNTVYATSKWNSTADEMDASKVTEKNVKKVAKKLKIDGVIEGKIEKRRDEYIVTLKLRGKDGDIVATVKTKAEGNHLDGSAMRDVKDELVPRLDELAVNRGGGGGDDDDDTASPPPKKKDPPKKTDDDDDSDSPPAKKGFSKKHPVKGNDSTDDDSDAPPKKTPKKDPPKKDPPKKVEKKHDDDDDSPIPKSKTPKKAEKTDDDATADDDAPKKPVKKKKVAKTDDDGNVIEDSTDGSGDEEPSTATMTSPGERAVDLVAGVSFMARRMGFTYSADLGKPPPGYKGVPVGGFLVDATVFPADLSHKRDDMLKNLGLTLMVDKVIKISSKVNLNGTPTTLDTSEMHYALGVVFRYPFNKTPTSPVIGGSLRYGGQSFTIARSTEADIPNVAYKIIDPGVFLKYPANDKFTLNVNLGFMVITSAGDIQSAMSYGTSSVTGFEGELSGDYAITKNLFARAAFRFETIGFKFNGTGMQSTGRDNDATQDVFGARDTYVGGAVTLGYAY